MNSILRRLRIASGSFYRTPYPAEIHLPALGERWAVRYIKTASRCVQARSNGEGVLTVSGRVRDREQVLRGLRRWLVRRARTSLPPWLGELGHQAGLSYGTVAIRGQRTRWASCSSRGTISLNYRLLFLDPDAVRYILHHELCHTIHLNHSRRFWQMLSSVEPGYRELRRKVRKGMEEVPEWANG